MNARVKLVLLQNLVQSLAVADIDLMERYALERVINYTLLLKDFGNPAQTLRL